jgi:hypothetical protein
VTNCFCFYTSAYKCCKYAVLYEYSCGHPSSWSCKIYYHIHSHHTYITAVNCGHYPGDSPVLQVAGIFYSSPPLHTRIFPSKADPANNTVVNTQIEVIKSEAIFLT